jgi:nucleoside-diphosphate-sugar epimerase
MVSSAPHMRAVVTGAAGFVGSTLSERLVREGHDVVGVDCFTDYYPRALKEANVVALRASPRFELVEADLAAIEIAPLLRGVDAVFHQAAQAGVRASWGTTFESYTHHNVLATQRLLEAVKGSSVKRFVYASSSSIYGDTLDLPMREASRPRPHSPYGVTKLAGEHLVDLYAQNFGVSAVSLRYFTVYGPRQRPDMGFHRFIVRLLRNEALPIYGSGEQTRDFTFIDDIVEANLLALKEGVEGVYNIGGGSRVTLSEVIATLGKIVGREIRIDRQPDQAGDVAHTEADTTLARERLGYAPRVTLEQGLQKQVESLRDPS